MIMPNSFITPAAKIMLKSHSVQEDEEEAMRKMMKKVDTLKTFFDRAQNVKF